MTARFVDALAFWGFEIGSLLCKSDKWARSDEFVVDKIDTSWMRKRQKKIDFFFFGGIFQIEKTNLHGRRLLSKSRSIDGRYRFLSVIRRWCVSLRWICARVRCSSWNRSNDRRRLTIRNKRNNQRMFVVRFVWTMDCRIFRVARLLI